MFRVVRIITKYNGKYWVGGEIGELLFSGIEFQLYKIKRGGDGGGDGCTTSVYLIPLNFKMVKTF